VKFSGLMSSCIRAIQNCCWCVNHDGSNNLANSNNLQKLPALSKTKFLMSHYSHCLSLNATIMMSKGRDTLGNKLQRQVSAISRVMCTASETSRLFRLFRHSDLLHKIKPDCLILSDRSMRHNSFACHTRRLVALTCPRDTSL